MKIIEYSDEWKQKWDNFVLTSNNGTMFHMQKFFDVDDSHFHFGLEFLFNQVFALRGGYMTNYEAKDFTFGFGLIWGRLNLDYAYSSLKYDLGSGNSISIKLRF